jgi:hypothetical protein
MGKELLVYVVILAIFIIALGVLWYKDKKNLVKEILLRAMTIAEVALGSKKGQEKLAIALEQAVFKISTWGKISGWIAGLIFTRENLKNMIEALVPKINQDYKMVIETQKEIEEKKVKEGVEIAINYLVEKAIPLDFEGNQEIIHNNQLIQLAEELKIEAKDKGFFVAEAGVNGNTERKGVDYYGKAGLGIKF